MLASAGTCRPSPIPEQCNLLKLRPGHVAMLSDTFTPAYNDGRCFLVKIVLYPIVIMPKYRNVLSDGRVSPARLTLQPESAYCQLSNTPDTSAIVFRT